MSFGTGRLSKSCKWHYSKCPDLYLYSNANNNNNKFISSRQVQSVKQSEYKQRVLIIAYRRLPESYKLSMLATYDT